MKTLLTSIAILGLAVSAFAQGKVLFDNNYTGEIDVSLNGSGTLTPAYPIGDPNSNPQNTVWHVGLLFNATPGGGIAQADFTEVADYTPTEVNNPFDGPGYFQDTGSNGREVLITVPSLNQVSTFEVVSWLGSATTWFGPDGASQMGENVFAATQEGQLVEFNARVANMEFVPPEIPLSINSPGQWNGNAVLANGTIFMTVIPEPSSFAVGMLGAASFLLFRGRRFFRHSSK